MKESADKLSSSNGGINTEIGLGWSWFSLGFPVSIGFATDNPACIKCNNPNYYISNEFLFVLVVMLIYIDRSQIMINGHFSVPLLVA